MASEKPVQDQRAQPVKNMEEPFHEIPFERLRINRNHKLSGPF
jgi:hypothetical protein